MFLTWLLLCLFWGIFGGFPAVPLVAWLLLIPFGYQDYWDLRLKNDMDRKHFPWL